MKIEQLWRAPELQTSYSSTSIPSSQFVGNHKGDVYSFAIIVQEILYRKGVFYLTDEDKENAFKSDYENFKDASEFKITYKGETI